MRHRFCERLGFTNEAQWTPVGDLSGGERRRLQLTRLLMGGPNVLILDEPTNDFDVETLASLEDLLDSFSGTLLVVSHDRYFLERVCDTFVAVLGDGGLRDLPRGLEEFLELRALQDHDSSMLNQSSAKEKLSSSTIRDLQKELAKLERSIGKVYTQIKQMHEQMELHATDFVKVAELSPQLVELNAQKSELEDKWLKISEKLLDT